MEPLDLWRLLQMQELKATHAVRTRSKDTKVLPVFLQGGVGDNIMDIAVVEELASQTEVEVYCSHPDVFNYFKSDQLPKARGATTFNCTWALTVNALARFQKQGEFSRFRNPWGLHLFEKQQEHFARNPFLKVLCDQHPNFDTILCRYGRQLGIDRRGMPFHSLGFEIPKSAKPARRKPALPLITVHDGVETAAAGRILERSTKQWMIESWELLIDHLRDLFPRHSFVQLGAKHAREIPGTHENLAGKTTIIEAIDYLTESCLHIDGDSGLVHAATALGIPCIVMFGPTPDYFYGYPQNVNIRATTCSEACYWLNENWISQCPIGYDSPKCMDDIPYTHVLEAAINLTRRI